MPKHEPSRQLLPRWFVVGFTGHREITHPEKVTEGIRHALNRLSMHNPQLAGISSAASGSDTLFAEEMIRRDCPIIIVLPFPPERFKEDFKHDPHGWGRSRELMRRAVEVEVVQLSAADQHDLSHGDGMEGHAKPHTHTKGDKHHIDAIGYMEAGVRTVDRADVLIAVWNGQPGQGFGGTADAVAYARDLHKALMIVHPVTGQVTEEQLPPVGTTIPPPLDRIKDPRKMVEAYLEEVDGEATQCAPRARQLIRWCLRLHLIASSFGAFALSFEVNQPLGTIAAALEVVVIAAALLMLIPRGKRYRIWLQCRANAEVCRSFLASWDIRRHPTLSNRPRPPISELRQLFTDLRMLRRIDKSPLPNFDNARDHYIEHRVIDQIKYFHRKHKVAVGEYERRKWIMQACTSLAFLSAFAALFLSIYQKMPLLMHSVEFLGICLPLCTTAFGILLITDETSRRNIRYKEMADSLQAFERLLKACRTWDSLARLVTQVEEELLQEVLEWRAFVRHTEHLH